MTSREKVTTDLLPVALAYAAQGYEIFPCRVRDKTPLTPHGFYDATSDPAIITEWWSRWRRCLPAARTGRDFAVLDIDVKGARDGLQTLRWLGIEELPATPTARTRSGGWHLYFKQPIPPIGNTIGDRGRGIGIGLDWRGVNGYVILPAPGTGYRWVDSTRDLPLADVPPLLLPKPTPVQAVGIGDAAECTELHPYGRGAIQSACENIRAASNGQQYVTLNGEAYSLGRLVGAGGAPAEIALSALVAAANGIASYDQSRPWRSGQAEKIVRRAFEEGRRNPRPPHDYTWPEFADDEEIFNV